LENWAEAESKKFIERFFQYLDTLANEPFIARKTYKTKHTYIGVIIPQISVIYRVKPRSKIIELVTFIDNRQSLKKNRRLL
jgi:plasmid stabilization system protein ParE